MREVRVRRNGLWGVGGVCAGHAGAVRGSCRGRIEEHRCFSAVCEMRCAEADELHRKERTALRLDWRHLPSLPFLRSASRCDWKAGTPGTGDDSDSDGYGRSKAADVTRGVGDRYIHPYSLTEYGRVKENRLKPSDIALTLDIFVALVSALTNTFTQYESVYGTSHIERLSNVTSASVRKGGATCNRAIRLSASPIGTHRSHHDRTAAPSARGTGGSDVRRHETAFAMLNVCI